MILFSEQKKKFLLSWLAGAGISAGIIIAVWFISSMVYFRLDLSDEKLYSLSPASKKIAAKTGDPVLITLYYSKNLPPQIAVVKRYFADIVKEYVAAPKSKVRASFIELQNTDDDKQKALKAGVLPVRFDVLSKDKYEQTEGFFGAVIQYKDKKEIIPFVNSSAGLEYTITSKIKSFITAAKPAVAFYHGKGAKSFSEFPPDFIKYLNSRYELKPLDLDAKDNADIDPAVRVVFLLGPEEIIGDDVLRALDKYLINGGAIFAAFDNRNVNTMSFSAVKNKTNLPDFFARYGIKTRQGIIIDKQCQPVQVARKSGGMVISNIVSYPPFLVVNDMDRENPALKDLDSVIFPFASAVSAEAAGPPLKSAILAKTTENSWILEQEKEEMIQADPFKGFAVTADTPRGPFGVLAYIEGAFTPYFPENKIAEPKKGRLVAAGTSRFSSAQYAVPESNYIFLANMADWLAQDEDLISIRIKSAGFKPLNEVSAFKKQLIKYANIFFPPFLIAFLGVLFWKARRIRNSRAGKTIGL